MTPALKTEITDKGTAIALIDEITIYADKLNEKQLIEILKSDHKHKTASSYAKCSECQQKREERKQKMKDIGFKSIQQYMEWKKIHEIIRNKKSFQLR